MMPLSVDGANMKSLRIKYFIAFLIGALLGIGYFASAVLANADTSQVSIASNGQTAVRGAKVIKVLPQEIHATSMWGAAKITWRIRTGGSTRFVPEIPSRTMTQVIKPGHIIGFSGEMDMSEGMPTIIASSVRDESVVQSGVILGGSVVDTTKKSIVVQTESGTSTVAVGTGTIMTLDGEPVSPRDLKSGYMIKAFGTLNTLRREMVAERITVAAPDVPLSSQPEPSRGLLSSIVQWLRGDQGTFSVR